MAATLVTHRRGVSHRQKRSIAHTFVHAVLIVVSAACALPLLLILAASFTDEAALVRQGFRLIPAQATLDAYRFLFNDPAQIVRAYGVSTFVTVVGASVSLFLMSMLAYALSRRDFALRQAISFFIFFPALFSAGMVPFYILMVRTLGLKDNILALILPPLVIPFFVLLLRTYFSTIPKDLIDAARIDGASEFLIYFRVVLPLSTPALATVGLFSLLFYWNDLYLSLLFINDRNLYNLQYLLFQIISNIQLLEDSFVAQGMKPPLQSVRMAMAVLAMGPMLFAFMFVQRFFVKGITLGGLKGD